MSDWRAGVYHALGGIARQVGANENEPIPLGGGPPAQGGTLDPQAFQYGLPWVDGAPWSSAAVFVIRNADHTFEQSFPVADAVQRGSFRFFAFAGFAPGTAYLGEIRDEEASDVLFGPIELSRLFDPNDPHKHLPPPPPDPEAPLPSEPGGNLGDILVDDADTANSLDAQQPGADAFS